MTWSAALNVALGLILAYLGFSVAASRINEFVASRLQWRAAGLERALYTLLGGTLPGAASAGAQADRQPVADTTHVPELSATAVKNHPIIAAFDSQSGKGRRSSYLPARAVSAAILDILAPSAVILLDAMKPDVPAASASAFTQLREHPDPQHFAAFAASLPATSTITAAHLTQLQHAIDGDVLAEARAAVENLPSEVPARRTLLRMLADAAGDRDAFRKKLEHWYDDAMDRVSGWYRRRVQKCILAYGAVLAIAFNVDTINIAQTLWRSPVEQSAAAAAAATAAGKNIGAVDTSITGLKGLNVPLGWTWAHTAPVHGHSRVSTDPRRLPSTIGQWVLKIFGLALTTLALNFGAPFWFDALGKIARLRNTGRVPAKSSP
jgi:hypothetical protein